MVKGIDYSDLIKRLINESKKLMEKNPGNEEYRFNIYDNGTEITFAEGNIIDTIIGTFSYVLEKDKNRDNIDHYWMFLPEDKKMIEKRRANGEDLSSRLLESRMPYKNDNKRDYSEDARWEIPVCKYSKFLER